MLIFVNQLKQLKLNFINLTGNVCKRQNNGNFLIFQFSIAQWWVSAGVCDDPSCPVRTHHKTPHSGSPLTMEY